jgi:hypothetical protein
VLLGSSLLDLILTQHEKKDHPWRQCQCQCQRPHPSARHATVFQISQSSATPRPAAAPKRYGGSESQLHVTHDHSSAQMNGISSRGSVNRIELPSSVEVISSDELYSCSSLTEVIFGSDCHVKEIRGFSRCRSLW